MKKILAMFLTVLLLLTAGLSASADTIAFSDETGEITYADSAKIQTALEKLERLYGISVYGALEYSGASDSTPAYRLSEAKLLELAGELDGILFYVDLTTRQWDICAFGSGKKILTEDVLDLLEEEIQSPLEDGEYAEAFLGFASQMDYVLSLERDGTAYETPFPWVKYLLLALVIGLVVAGISVWVMASKLKSVHRQAAARNYLKDGSLDVTESRDIFLYRTVTRTPRPKESSSSSGGRSNGSVGRSGRF